MDFIYFQHLAKSHYDHLTKQGPPDLTSGGPQQTQHPIAALNRYRGYVFDPLFRRDPGIG